MTCVGSSFRWRRARGLRQWRGFCIGMPSLETWRCSICRRVDASTPRRQSAHRWRRRSCRGRFRFAQSRHPAPPLPTSRSPPPPKALRDGRDLTPAPPSPPIRRSLMRGPLPGDVVPSDVLRARDVLLEPTALCAYVRFGLSAHAAAPRRQNHARRVRISAPIGHVAAARAYPIARVWHDGELDDTTTRALRT